MSCVRLPLWQCGAGHFLLFGKRWPDMNLPKRNSADGRCYWMKPEVQEELQPLFDQCIQDAIDGRITRLDSLWPPVVVSSEGAPFEVWQLLRTWTEAQRAETLDAEKSAILNAKCCPYSSIIPAASATFLLRSSFSSCVIIIALQQHPDRICEF